jgi:hypothetical protein
MLRLIITNNTAPFNVIRTVECSIINFIVQNHQYLQRSKSSTLRSVNVLEPSDFFTYRQV